MRPALVAGPGQVEVTSVPDPNPGSRDVVVAVAACGTDLHILDGGHAPSLPLVPARSWAIGVRTAGAAGVVLPESVDVADARLGDRVLIDGAGPMACRCCRPPAGTS